MVYAPSLCNKFSSAAAGFLAVFLHVTPATDGRVPISPPQTPDYDFGPALDQALEIITLCNAEGDCSKIVIFDDAKINVLKQNPHWNETNDRAAITQHLTNRGFPPNIAESISLGFMIEYRTSFGYETIHAYPLHGPDLNHLNPRAGIYDSITEKMIPSEEQIRVGAYCKVSHLTTDFNGQSWIRPFLEMKDDLRLIKLPQEFGPEFSQFVRLHELAHCMGAGEAEADFVAALHILKNHPDKKKAIDFLQLMGSIRITNTIFNEAAPKYYGTFLAIQSVIDTYNTTSGIDLSNEEIWSRALHKRNKINGTIDTVIFIAKQRQYLIEEKNFGEMARYLKEESLYAGDPDLRAVLINIGAHLEYISGFIEPPVPSPSLPQSP